MADRRNFLKNTVLTSAGLLILPSISFSEVNSIADDLEKGFLNPPATAKPQAFWMWMNGHVTKQGLTLDLIAMKEMGLAGAFIFNTNIGIPKGPVEYGSTQWQELLIHATEEAQRLGLELFFHNSPGFSSTGGAKVTPDMSMQQLVWSEMVVQGSKINVRLPQPFTKLGYYGDAIVVAYSSLAVEKQTMGDILSNVTVNGEEKDKNLLLVRTADSFILLPPGNSGQGILQIDFSEPFEARSITITRLSQPSTSVYDAAFDHPPVLVLESSDDGKDFKPVCTIQMPLMRYMDAPGTENFSPVRAKFFRLTSSQSTRITSIELHGALRLPDWPGKLNFTATSAHNNEQIVEEDFLIDPATVIELSAFMRDDGTLNWEAPHDGSWTILRIGHTCTGTTTVASPDGATGLEIDKFSKKAVEAYFNLYLNALIDQLKPFIPNTLKGILIDSYEIGKQNWTTSFPSEFETRRGYSLKSFAPALTGRIVQNVEETENFLWDFRRTGADLVAENYYGAFQKRCAAHGLQLYAQPNGDGIFDSLQVGQHLNQALSEFWVRYVPGTLNICKQAVSIAHGYGIKTIAAEAYTGMPRTSRWTEYPYALKSQGDYIYSFGINRFVLHLFVHQPYTTGFPGMTMGPYGTHFDRNNTWRKAAKEWVSYLSRTQYLLQHGLPVADILYYKGEEPTSGIPDVNYVNPPVPKTLAGDVIGPDVLLNRISIEGNKIVLPDGMQYRLLILAPLQKISIKVLQKLKSLVEQGMLLIVTTKPEGVTGRVDGESTSRAKKIISELWGNLDGKGVTERSLGKGKTYWNKELKLILEEHDIIPDFEFTSANSDAAIHYTHRRVGDTEIYFVSNHLRRRERIVCSFRVDKKEPEIWNAETGEIFQAALFSFAAGRTQMPLELEPAGAVFVLFRKAANEVGLQSVSHNGLVLASTENFLSSRQAPHQNRTNNFTILLWAKPDVPSDHPKGVLIFPPEGEVIYGNGHTACGMAAGQNGVRVFEREKGPNHGAREMIGYAQALEGWTHLALRYKDGKPSLFVNGRLVVDAAPSGKIVHPGLDTPPTDEFFSAAFEGAFTKPSLFTKALSDSEIQASFEQGLLSPDLPTPITLKQIREGKLAALIWQNGHYELKGFSALKTLDVKECKTISLIAPWQVHFPSGSGAPVAIELRRLESLHRHPNFRVKHFSGTATYHTSFFFDKKNVGDAHRLLLDLGRVEVVAQIELNGKMVGTLWKEPFRVDVTKAMRQGRNALTVRVTSLWPNRMIGDEYLPKEVDYDENGFVTKFPDWYLQNKRKEGVRICFSAWNTFKKTDPLLESGLLGPVRLIVGMEKLI